MSNDTNATIAALQGQVNQLTGGGGGKLSSTQLQALLAARPDVAAEAQRVAATADRNSPQFQKVGGGTNEGYAQYWYSSMGGHQQYDPNAATGTPASPAQTTANTVVTQATDATTQLVNQYKDLATSLGTQITQQQTDTTKLIGDLTTQFNNKQTDLLKGFQDAQTAQTAQMAQLTQQMQQAALGTGQGVKQPNYAAALARNKDLNASGLSATMLTGPAGVSTGAMALGATSLLGGSK